MLHIDMFQGVLGNMGSLFFCGYHLSSGAIISFCLHFPLALYFLSPFHICASSCSLLLIPASLSSNKSKERRPGLYIFIRGRMVYMFMLIHVNSILKYICTTRYNSPIFLSLQYLKNQEGCWTGISWFITYTSSKGMVTRQLVTTNKSVVIYSNQKWGGVW